MGGLSRPVRGLRRKAVLAVLALHPGEIVGTDRLVDAVWDEATPLTAANASHAVLVRAP
jgi:DNA-binding SARP family transcriptional activator